MRARIERVQTEMARQTEPSVNNALGGLLQGMLSRSDVLSENTQTITGHAGFHPDILIVDPGRSPVVIEAEYMPGANVEAEAKSRLGLDVAASGRRIEAVIALRYPDEIGDADDLRFTLCILPDGGKEMIVLFVSINNPIHKCLTILPRRTLDSTLIKYNWLLLHLVYTLDVSNEFIPISEVIDFTCSITSFWRNGCEVC